MVLLTCTDIIFLPNVPAVLVLIFFLQLLTSKPVGRVAVLLGSSSDADIGNKICDKLREFEIDSELRVTSAHKGPDTTLKIIAGYESKHICICFLGCQQVVCLK